ncbi:TPA: ATP-binding protein [Pseudomonas aeruginosa]
MGVAESLGVVSGDPEVNVGLGSPEQRRFNVHPGIIKHLIKEQAGTLVKAVTELVMNSVDAGATRVDLEFREDGTFTVRDNGRGFRDRSEIENFFETFGTPHEEGDATYGRFRIGRGQIMAFANTIWRSGNFQMDVNLLDAGAEFGYTLTEIEQAHVGCQIDGVILDENVIAEAKRRGLIGDDYWSYEDDRDFISMVRFVEVPVFLAGEQINSTPDARTWSYEDDFGYYLFDKSYGLNIYNQGVYVATADRKRFSVGGIFVSKKPIPLNMARNTWMGHGCEVLENLRKVARSEYLAAIERSAQMSDCEVGAIIHRIATHSENIEQQEAALLFEYRFLPAFAGRKVSPKEFLSATRYSYYNRDSSLVAERAIKEGGIALLLPQTFNLARLSGSPETAWKFIVTMRKLFDEFVENKTRDFVYFEKIIESYSGTFIKTPDTELSERKLAALKAIRYIRWDLKRLAGDITGEMRALVAGKSDCADAWTNGFDYIAFDERVLEYAYTTRNSGGIERLVNLAIHEFCHQAESSEDTHAHTLEFYKLYHDATLSMRYSEVVRICHRRYMSLLAKAGLKISGEDRRHANALGKIVSEAEAKHPVNRRGKTR